MTEVKNQLGELAEMLKGLSKQIQELKE